MESPQKGEFRIVEVGKVYYEFLLVWMQISIVTFVPRGLLKRNMK